MAGNTYTWNGGTGSADTPTNWTPNGEPNSGDIAIALSGDVVLPNDAQLNSNTLEASNATLTFVGGLSTNFEFPTTDPTSVITNQVSGVATPETTVLDSAGVFVNQGSIIADGPAGSTLTVNISASGTVPGYFFNSGTMTADAGNTLLFNVGSASVLFNTGEIVADGGTVGIHSVSSAITGGYGPVRGLALIEAGGTIETNAAYALNTNGGTGPYFVFVDEAAGNSLLIDNVGSFDGRIAGFAAGDTIDLGSSLAVGTLVYQGNDGFLYFENNAGTVLASLLLSGPYASGTFALPGGAADGFVIGTGADGDTILTSTVTNTVASGVSGSWQSASSWVNGTVPGGIADPVIGQGATAAFTLNTGSGTPVSVAGFLLESSLATLDITSNVTATPQTIGDFAGTLDVAGGNTLTASSLTLFTDSSAVTIAAGAAMDLSGHPNSNLAAVAGDWTLQSGNTFAVTVSAGTLEVDGSLLAGPPTAAGGGGSFVIGYDSNGQPASATVNGGGTVTDTRTLLGSDPTSSGDLTLNGAGASMTDETDAADPLNSRGYIAVGYNDLVTNTPTGFAAPPGPLAAAQLLIENDATLTEQSHAFIGDSVGSAGTVTVTSGGLWAIGLANGGFVNVGDTGQGALFISNGGTVDVGATGTILSNGTTSTSGGVAIGYAGTSGTVSVASSGVLISAGGIGVGHTGPGTLDVKNGGTVEAIGNGMAVGQAGPGLLEIEAGGTVVDSSPAHGISIGQTVGSSGTILVTGPGALLSITAATNGFGIGAAGSGLLDIESDGVVALNSTGFGIAVGQTAGANGTIIVDGTAALLSLGTTTSVFNIGSAGSGTLLVENSGEVLMNGTSGIAAGFSGATGSITVTSHGSLFAASGMVIGNSGTGFLNVTGGGATDIIGGSLIVGESSLTGVGTVTVSGAGSLLTLGTATAGAFVGQSGRALLQVTSGGTVSDTAAPALTIGQNSGSNGTVVVSSANSLLSLTGTSNGIIVGSNGQGTLDAQSSGVIDTTNLSLGGSMSGPLSGHGTVAVTGGGTLEATNAVAVWGGSTLSVDVSSAIDIGTSGSTVLGDILVENGHTLFGSGLVSGNVVNNGTILAIGTTGAGIFPQGTLELTGSLSGSGALDLVSLGILRVDGALAPAEAISFGSGGGDLILMTPGAGLSNAVTGLSIGDKIDFNFTPGTVINSASVTSPGTVTVFTNTGSYLLTNVGFAAGAPQLFGVSTDFTGGTSFQAIQVSALNYGWTGATSTNLGTASNWFNNSTTSTATSPPNNDTTINFGNVGGTLTGTANAADASFGGFGTWVLQGATLNLAGLPNPPYGSFAAYFSSNAIINGGTVNAAGNLTIDSTNGATVTAENGAVVNTFGDTVGNAIGQGGTLVITGPNTTWTELAGSSAGYLNVGIAGPTGGQAGSAGSLLVSNGATLNTQSNVDIGSNSGAFGTVMVSSAQWNVGSGGFQVGFSGVGTLAVTNGTVANAGFMNIGANVGSSGSVNLSSGSKVSTNGLGIGASGAGTLVVSGSTITNTGGLSIGANTGGSGTLTLSSGTLTDAGFANLGQSTDSVGLASINAGGVLTANGFNIGSSGLGVLAINAGTVTSFGTLSGTVLTGGGVAVGQGFGGDGSLSVTGGGRFSSNGLTIGSSGDGTLTINNGVVSDTGSFGIGTGGGSFGTAAVANGTLTIASTVNIGTSGDGELTINAGGTVISSGTVTDFVGNSPGSDGLLDVEAGGTFEVTMVSQGSINALNIGNAAASNTLPGATGNVLVSGAGALLTTNNNPVGVGSGGLGNLTVTQGGSVSVGSSDTNLNNALNVGNSGGTGSVTINGDGSTLTANGFSVIGRGGAGSLLVENNGRAIFNDAALDGGGLSIGDGRSAGPSAPANVGGNGVAVVTSGGVLEVNSTTSGLNVGGNGVNGALTVNNGGMVLAGTAIAIGTATSASGTVYGGTGQLDIGAGGTVFVNNPVAANGYDVYVGTANSSIGTSTAGTSTGADSGQVVVSGAGALLNSNGLGIAVGWLSDGSLMISQGATVLSGSPNDISGNALSIGRRSTGSVTITDPGSDLTATGVVYVARAGTGSLTIENGGSLSSLADPTGVAGISVGGIGLGVSISNGVTYVITGGSGFASVTSGGDMFSQQSIKVGNDGAEGTLNIGAGGTAEAGSQLLIGTNITVAAGDTIISPAGSIISNGTVLGSSGGVNVTAGGLLQIDDSSPGMPGLVIGSDSGSTGALNVTGANAIVLDSGALIVGQSGAGNLLIQGGTVTATTADAGTQSGSAGIISVTGTGSDLVTTGSLSIGDNGAGELSILNGANVHIGGDLDIGQTAGGSGNVDIEDSGGTVFIGGNINIGAGGPAELTVGLNTTVELDSGGLIPGAFASVNLFSAFDAPPFLNYANPTNILATQTQSVLAYANNSGQVNIRPGVTYTVNTPVIDGSGGVFQLGTNAAELILNADTVSGQTIDFTDATGKLVLGFDQLATIDVPPSGTSGFTSEANPNLGLPLIGGFGGVISGFQTGDEIIVTTTTAATFSQSGSVVSVIANSATLGALTFATVAQAGAAMAGGLSDTQPCFVAGTRIATERGEVAVEDLTVGDRVHVMNSQARPIVWLGHRGVDCVHHPDSRKVWPVRVCAGAFGPGRPCRDLWLSPDHALFVDDVLIPVKYLINGTTIAQVPVDEVTYYHVELPQHAVILAEGLPAESYLDTGDRRNFANGGGPVTLFPDFSSRIWDAEGCAPLVVTGPQLDAARRWVNGLAGRAILAA